MTERGLIVSSPIQVGAFRLTVAEAGLDLQEIRFALLFWDKFDFPVGTTVQIGCCDIADYLASCGLLNRTEIDIQGGEIADIVRRTYVEAFHKLSEAEPGVWSISTGPQSIVFLDGDLEPARGVIFKLHQAIPVPNQDVPLADILEFKAKRRSELLALRYHMEQLYQKVVAQPDATQSLNTEMIGLGLAINDYLRASRGLGWLFRLVDLDASLNIRDAAIAAAAAYSLSQSIAAAVAAGAACSIKPGPALKTATSIEMPFQYVTSYHKEVFSLS